jgi:hypothetical protein
MQDAATCTGKNDFGGAAEITIIGELLPLPTPKSRPRRGRHDEGVVRTDATV